MKGTLRTGAMPPLSQEHKRQIDEALEDGVRRGLIERIESDDPENPTYKLTPAGYKWLEERNKGGGK